VLSSERELPRGKTSWGSRKTLDARESTPEGSDFRRYMRTLIEKTRGKSPLKGAGFHWSESTKGGTALKA